MSESQSVWSVIKEDFNAERSLSTYEGEDRKTFHALTSVGFQAVSGYRLTQWLCRNHIPLLGIIIQRLVELWAGVSISPRAQIGPGLVIFHFGQIVINQAVVMGSHCRLHHDVTIGNRVPGGGSPKIGDRVMIGAGARVLGDITIGNDVEIGANAVVLESLPDGAVAVGVPARVVRVKTGQGERDTR